MEILLWLVPSAVVTVAAMVWVSVIGREGRGEVDRDVAVARLAHALEKGRPVRSSPRSVPAPDRSTGIAVRPSRTTPPGTPRRMPRDAPRGMPTRRGA
jgi:hypothetical protein